MPLCLSSRGTRCALEEGWYGPGSPAVIREKWNLFSPSPSSYRDSLHYLLSSHVRHADGVARSGDTLPAAQRRPRPRGRSPGNRQAARLQPPQCRRARSWPSRVAGPAARHPRPAVPQQASPCGPARLQPWARPGSSWEGGRSWRRGRRQGPPRRVRAPRPRPPAARPTFSLSPAPSAPSALSLPSAPLPPRASPPPAWSCVAFFCLQWKQFLAARRAPARRAAAEASGRRDGAGRAAGPAGGRAARRADAAGPMPRRDPRAPAARTRGRPPPPAAPGSPRCARASLAGPPSDARWAPAKVCRLPLKGSGAPAPRRPAPAR